MPTTIPTEAEVEARKAGADDTANGSKQPQDTRIAQITGESGIQWDPVSKLFEIVIGGVIVGAVATWNAASDLYHHAMKSQRGRQGKVGDTGIRNEAQELIDKAKAEGKTLTMREALDQLMKEAKQGKNGKKDTKRMDRIKGTQKSEDARQSRESKDKKI